MAELNEFSIDPPGETGVERALARRRRLRVGIAGDAAFEPDLPSLHATIFQTRRMLSSSLGPNFPGAAAVQLEHIVLRTPVALALLVCIAPACGNGQRAGDCSGPCPTSPHHWTAKEIARDMNSVVFPVHHGNRRDHLYHTRCRITQGGTHAICTGRRRFGPNPGELVVAEGLLRQNGSWDLLCWPKPSELCDKVEIREQRANPVTA